MIGRVENEGKQLIGWKIKRKTEENVICRTEIRKRVEEKCRKIGEICKRHGRKMRRVEAG